MKFVCITVLMVIASFNLFSQNTIEVKEVSESIGNGINKALMVMIYDDNEKLIEKEWKDLMKSFNAKVSIKNEILADNALIGSLSDIPIKIHARIEKMTDAIKLIVGFNIGETFLSSSKEPDKYKSAESIVYNFAVDVSKKANNEKLKQAKKEQDKMENKLEQLVKDNDRLHIDIENYNKKIEEAKNAIVTNEKNQESTKGAIEKQKAAVKAIEEKGKTIK